MKPHEWKDKGNVNLFISDYPLEIEDKIYNGRIDFSGFKKSAGIVDRYMNHSKEALKNLCYITMQELGEDLK
ncbi:hypothetical protein HOD29_04665 [archaeon]|nr:hypothetical protein [archaeon]